MTSELKESLKSAVYFSSTILSRRSCITLFRKTIADDGAAMVLALGFLN